VGSMERVNRQSRRDSLTAGDKIVVYAEQARHARPNLESSPVALGNAKPPHPEVLPGHVGQSPLEGPRVGVPAGTKTLD
jgi:hypothetical protein